MANFRQSRREVTRMAVYIAFPVLMYAIFNQPWFYESAIYEARLAFQKQRDVEGSALLRKSIALTKQDMLRKKIEAREKEA